MKHHLFILIFFICTGIVLGPAYNTFRHYDYSHSQDSYTYLEMAKGNYDVSPVRRYRPIVPFLAGSLSNGFGFAKKVFEKSSGNRDSTLPLTFFVINSIFIGLAGTALFFLCQAYGLSALIALISTLPFLTSRWTNYSAGLPLVDSLYFLSIFAFLYGIKKTNFPLVMLTCVIGPFSKEMFLLFFPLVFVYFPSKRILTGVFMLTCLLGYFAFRFWIDVSFPVYGNQSPLFDHVSNIPDFLKSIVSFHTIGDVFFVFGFFAVIVVASLFFHRSNLSYCTKDLGILIWVIPFAIIHILLSGWYVGRMFFLIVPLFSVVFGRVVENQLKKYFQQTPLDG